MIDVELLHLSDLHWCEAERADRKIVIEALIKDLECSLADGDISPDFVIFSGDLAQSGDDPAQFEGALESMLLPVLQAVKLDKDKLFIAPGNHDISRSLVRGAPFIETGLRQTLRSIEEVNGFLDKLCVPDSAEHLAIERVRSFYEFSDQHFPADEAAFPLLRCYIRQVGALKVGIASFNSAWRATGEPDDIDRNNLLIGERNVDHAIEALKDTDIRLAIMHHPMDWLAEFDELAVASRISSQFDVVFCGHTHRSIPQTRTTAQGTAILSQAGTMYASRNWFNGYQSVKLSSADEECKFLVRTYNDIPRREFDKATNVARDGLVTFPYRPTQRSSVGYKVESFLRQMRQLIRQFAADHMNMLGASGFKVADIKEAFVLPPLSRRGVRSADDVEISGDRDEEVTAEDVLRSEANHLIIGARETGKTSLLHYLAVLCAEGVCDQPRIPVVLNANSLKANAYNLKRAIANYYFGAMPTGFDVDAALRDGAFLFLIDDLSDGAAPVDALQDHKKRFPDNRWICTTAPRPGSITGQSEEGEALADFRNVRIGMLPRRSIRSLAKRWCGVLGHADDAVFNAVMKQIKRDGLPRTAYMVTLLVWAIQQEKEFERINEAILLSNVVDHLLGRADFTQSLRGTFDPRAKEITLEHLAEHLKSQGGTASVNDVTTFLVELFQNTRLPFVAVDALSELVKCGILDRTGDMVRFKYPCFGEYFMASRMRSEPEAFDRGTRDGAYFENAREIELLAGLRRQNSDILNLIVSDMKVRTPVDLATISADKFDSLTEVSLAVTVSQKKLSDLRKKRFSAEQIDDLMDAAERRATRRLSESDASTTSGNGGETALPKSLASPGTGGHMSSRDFLIANDLLAAVVRSSDFTDFSIKGPATKLVIENMVRVCLLVRDEVLSLLNDTITKDGRQSISEDDKTGVLYLVNRFLVFLTASVVSDRLASPNVVPMAEEIILQKDLTTAERIFLCYLLQECRATKWNLHFSDLLEEKANSGFVVDSVIDRIKHIVNTQYLDDTENAKLHSVIDTAEQVLGWATGVKGRMISDLKKTALKADLRDDRI